MGRHNPARLNSGFGMLDFLFREQRMEDPVDQNKAVLPLVCTESLWLLGEEEAGGKVGIVSR